MYKSEAFIKTKQTNSLNHKTVRALNNNLKHQCFGQTFLQKRKKFRLLHPEILNFQTYKFMLTYSGNQLRCLFPFLK